MDPDVVERSLSSIVVVVAVVWSKGHWAQARHVGPRCCS